MVKAKKSNRVIKRKVLELLQTANLSQGLNELCRLPVRQVINPLFHFLFSSDEKVRWRAISAIGAVVANLAEKDMESARVIMRRLMWGLNDESGGIGWGAPEAMGEIIASHEKLAKEYAAILTSYVRQDGNFLEYEPLQRGAVWAIGRVAQARPDLVQDAFPHLLPYLESTDSTVRGITAWVIGMLGAEEAYSQLEKLLEDESEVPLYLDHRLVSRRVSDLAKEALDGIAKSSYVSK